MSRTILVTGAGGYLGAAIVHALLDDGDDRVVAWQHAHVAEAHPEGGGRVEVAVRTWRTNLEHLTPGRRATGRQPARRQPDPTVQPIHRTEGDVPAGERKRPEGQRPYG